MLKCKFNGGTLPIGYITDEEQHFQIEPLTAPFVLDVFKKYDKGATMKELRDWLNENGIRNKLGKPLNFNSIQHMLSNRRYIGEYKYRDIVVPDGIPAIVPEDLFDRVQEKLAQNRKAPAVTKPRTITCSPPSCSAATAVLTSAVRAAKAGTEPFTTTTSACP